MKDSTKLGLIGGSILWGAAFSLSLIYMEKQKPLPVITNVVKETSSFLIASKNHQCALRKDQIECINISKQCINFTNEDQTTRDRLVGCLLEGTKNYPCSHDALSYFGDKYRMKRLMCDPQIFN